MGCGSSPTPRAACGWSGRSPSKPTRAGSRAPATSTWNTCANTRRRRCAKSLESSGAAPLRSPMASLRGPSAHPHTTNLLNLTHTTVLRGVGAERLEERPQMLLVAPPALHGGLIDRLAHLGEAGGAHRALGLVEA